MNRFGFTMLVALMLIWPATSPFAQSQGNPAAPEQPAARPDGTGTGTEGRGATGWTGGSRGPTDQVTGRPGAGPNSGQPGARPNGEAAAQQPFMATGEDLKGPPTQFPAPQTPE